MGNDKNFFDKTAKEIFFEPLFGMTRAEEKEWKKGFSRSIAIVMVFFGYFIINFSISDINIVIEKIKNETIIYLGICIIGAGILLYIIYSINFQKYKKEFKMSVSFLVIAFLLTVIFGYYFSAEIFSVFSLAELTKNNQTSNTFSTFIKVSIATFKDYSPFIVFVVLFCSTISSVLYMIKLFILSIFDNFNKKIGSTKDSLTLLIAIFGAIVSIIALSK